MLKNYRFQHSHALALTLGAAICLFAGCSKPDPIVTYTIPTQLPEQFKAGKDRMLAAMVPRGQDVWFFKVTGPESAITSVETTFRDFVKSIEFSGGNPKLSDLPDGWRRGGDKPMRFASLDVQTPNKQLDISISKLLRQSDWDEMVKMNVNRWRGQLGLSASEEKWAEGKSIDIASADTAGIWVDLVGEPSSGAPSMKPPFASNGMFAGSNPSGEMPNDAVHSGVGSKTPPSETAPMEPDPRLKFDRPDGWRDGRMSSMRMAAFNVGPVDSQAEITVIPAGGDLRGNVARWIGQVRGGAAPDEVVDQALQDAQKIEVDGHSGQRFLLTGEDSSSGTAIDATIVPLEGGVNLFVKMTGPVKTVTNQSDAIASFLESLKLNLK